MCKNWENGAKWTIFEKVRTVYERWTAQWLCAHACTLRTSQSRACLGAWPGTVSNATEAPKAPRGEALMPPRGVGQGPAGRPSTG